MRARRSKSRAPDRGTCQQPPGGGVRGVVFLPYRPKTEEGPAISRRPPRKIWGDIGWHLHPLKSAGTSDWAVVECDLSSLEENTEVERPLKLSILLLEEVSPSSGRPIAVSQAIAILTK